MLLVYATTFLSSLVINFMYFLGGYTSFKEIGTISGICYQVVKVIVLCLDIWMLQKFCRVVAFFIKRKKLKMEDEASI